MKYSVWFSVALAFFAVNSCANATIKKDAQASIAVKPKREASLSSGSSGYHGLSNKYLPPAAASVGVSTGGHNSYSSHGSSSSGFGSGIGYDFGAAAAHASAPKVQTFIVHTEPAHAGHSGGVSSVLGGIHGGAASSGGSSGHFSGGHSVGHSSAVASGYHYSDGTPHFQAAGASLHGHSNIAGGSYKVHTKARPQIETIFIPAGLLPHNSGVQSHSGSLGGAHTLHLSGGSGNFGNSGYHYAPNVGSSSHSGAGSFGNAHESGSSGSIGGSFGGSHGAGSAFSGHSNGGFGAHGGNSVTYNSQQGYSSGYDGGSAAAFGLGGSGTHGTQGGHSSGIASLSFDNQGGYSGNEYSKRAHNSIPSTSYGVPAVASYHGAGDSGSSYISSGHDIPAYAEGHKGLGHFSFSASKPHTLNTGFVSSGSSGHASGHGGGSSFKASTFLGNTAESAQYLPPTSPGYEFHSPSVLQGGVSAAGSASTTVHQPNSSYLPPGASYLPPQHH